MSVLDLIFWIFGCTSKLKLNFFKKSLFTAQIQAAALDGGARGDGDGEAASDSEDMGTKKGKKRGKSLKAPGPDRGKSAETRRTGSQKTTQRK